MSEKGTNVKGKAFAKTCTNVAIAAFVSLCGIAACAYVAWAASSDQVTRLYGGDRYATSAAIAADGWESSEWVVIATGENYADALAASSLAGALDAPILTVAHSGPDEATLAVISQLGAKSAIVVGGTSAVSAGGVETLEEAGLSVERIAGADRYETAAEIAGKVEEYAHSSICVVCSGAGFADALSASAYAYATQSPILLVSPDGATEQMVAAATAGGRTDGIIVGGTASVPDSAVEPLTSAGMSLERLGGENRYATSALMTGWALDNGSLSIDEYVGVSTGKNFPDALSGGAWCGRKGVPIVLADGAGAGRDLIDARAPLTASIVLFGGEAALADPWAPLPADDYKTTEYAQAVLDLVNAERANEGVASLTLSSALTNVACIKAQDMSDNRYFSHTSPTYGTPDRMMVSFGVSFTSAGENIAYGQTTPEQVMESWMNSEGHRANILKSSYTELGVGYYMGDTGIPYWVQMFIG